MQIYGELTVQIDQVWMMQGDQIAEGDTGPILPSHGARSRLGDPIRSRGTYSGPPLPVAAWQARATNASYLMARHFD